jgi:hypothetical protein
MRVIFIDAEKRTVEDRHIDVKTTRECLDAYYALIGNGCDTIEIATYLEKDDVVFVDEEGLLKQNEHFFDIGAHQPFAGNGVIVGPEVGEFATDVQISVEEVRRRVKFMSRTELRALLGR